MQCRVPYVSTPKNETQGHRQVEYNKQGYKGNRRRKRSVPLLNAGANVGATFNRHLSKPQTKQP